jgi:uncharacterized protein (TIGR04255 family)
LSERSVGIPAIPIPLEVQKIMATEFRIGMGASTKTFDFASDDNSWQVALSRGMLALSTTKYAKWEEFRERFSQALDALEEIYHPAFYLRVGLRYRNLIRRSNIGQKDTPWNDLLQPQIAGELVFPEIAKQTSVAKREIAIMLGSMGEKVVAKHGLNKPEDTEELCYVIDADFSRSERTEVADARGKLNDFNKLAGRFFRWCIKDRLHESLEPRPV